MSVLRGRRFWLRLYIPFTVILFLLIIYHSGSSGNFLRAPPAEASFSPKLHAFWAEFSEMLAKAQPKCPKPERRKDFKGDTQQSFEFVTKESKLKDALEMSPDDVKHMKEAHSWIVNEIQNNSPGLEYKPGTRGIVTTAGGKYFPVVVVSIKMLRRTGSTLPVEIFLGSRDEYEPRLCEVILPALNAKCLVLSDILNAVPTAIKIEKYQFKIMAMLFSSFEDVLFLDADNFPVRKPENIFDEEPYIESKMVTWPDFWAYSTSPYYYEIASQDLPDLSAQPSTEAGQIYISRKIHAQTLLLAAYYNVFGPSHYYKLFSQGAAGEGDKETFVMAATSLKKHYYQVNEFVSAIGFFQDGKFRGTAMVQHDPLQDYNLTSHGIYRSRQHQDIAPKPSALFIHANFPKLNAQSIMSGECCNWATTFPNGKKHRFWGDSQNVKKDFGYDLEQQVWEELLYTGCELEHEFLAWKQSTGICKTTKEYVAELFPEDRN